MAQPLYLVHLPTSAMVRLAGSDHRGQVTVEGRTGTVAVPLSVLDEEWDVVADSCFARLRWGTC